MAIEKRITAKKVSIALRLTRSIYEDETKKENGVPNLSARAALSALAQFERILSQLQED